jgi:hypothetical protein
LYWLFTPPPLRARRQGLGQTDRTSAAGISTAGEKERRNRPNVMMTYRRGRGIALLILNLGITWS